MVKPLPAIGIIARRETKVRHREAAGYGPIRNVDCRLAAGTGIALEGHTGHHLHPLFR